MTEIRRGNRLFNRVLFFVFLVLLIDLPIQLTKLWRRHSQQTMSEMLALLLKDAAPVSDQPRDLTWQQLQQSTTETLRLEFNGKNIRIPGYIVPLDDLSGSISEFLFVPSQLACIHVPPPPMNQTIYVTMKGNAKIKSVWGPVVLTGRFLLFDQATTERLAAFAVEGMATEEYHPE